MDLPFLINVIRYLSNLPERKNTIVIPETKFKSTFQHLKSGNVNVSAKLKWWIKDNG